MNSNQFKNRNFKTNSNLQLFCCSPYEETGIHSIKNLSNNHYLVFDSNITIYIRNLYFELRNNQKLNLGYFKNLAIALHLIRHKDLQVDYSFALQESCRRLHDYSLNFEKFNQSIKILDVMTNNSLEEIQNNIVDISIGEEIKDFSIKTESKLDSAKNFMRLSPLLIVNYISLLKIVLLDYNTKLSQIDKAIKLKEFIHEELDTSISTVEVFALIYFTDQKNKKVLKSSKDYSKQLHNLWNAANDLYSYYRVAYDIAQIPIFLTADYNLYQVFNRLKIKFVITDKGKVQGPFSATEVDFEDIDVNEKDFAYYILSINRIQNIRKRNYYTALLEKFSGTEKEYDYEKLLRLIHDFELDLKKYFA